MKTILSSRRQHYVARISIFLIIDGRESMCNVGTDQPSAMKRQAHG